MSDDEHLERRRRRRLRRYASEWSQGGRPRRLLLGDRDLDAMLLHSEVELTAVEAEFIRASRRRRGRPRLIAGIVAGAAGVSLTAGALVSFSSRAHDAQAASKPVGDASTDEQPRLPPPPPERPEAPPEDDRWIQHTVIPTETMEEIALRYDVPLEFLQLWNNIDEYTPLTPGSVLKVKTARDPLPWQKITYRPDRRESWSSLAQRFDVPVSKLRAYNPELGDAHLDERTTLTIYVVPKPLERNVDIQLPEFTVRPDAISVGAPQDGKIINAVQFPANEKLYKRRNPRIMWCSGYTAENLQRAIASFRVTYAFDGEIVIADMSKKPGGYFYPHKSHQAGRDVDVWLPTLEGVYQPSDLNPKRDRRPWPEEADWFALYGLLQALHETGAVEAVFLDYDLHDRVYKAARLMGASEQELDEMIAYPRGKGHRRSLLQHSANHTRHVHVRFACGPLDQCSKSLDEGPGD